MMRAVLLTLLYLGLGACGQSGRAIQLGDAKYYFPAPHVSAIVEPKESGSGQTYIRLIPPGDYYWLVYAPKRTGHPNRNGPNVPTIPHINDNRFNDAEVIKSEVGPLLCEKKPVNDHSAYMRQIFTCGFRIYDHGVPWTVVIPGDLAASAPALKRRAELTLADYRADERARKATPPS